MRGVGFGDVNLGQDAPVGIYIDGVYNGRTNVAMMQLVEPEQIEVLRGPQGTLFGRNTTGGAISVTTRTPSDSFGGMVEGSYGSFGAKGAQVRIDTGLLGASGVKLSFAGQHRQQDGTHDSGLTPPDRDPGSYRTDAYWFKAVGEWGGLQAKLSADYTKESGVPPTLQIVDATPAVRNMVALSPGLGGGGYPISPAPQYTIANDFVPRDQQVWAQGVALTLNYQVSDYLTLKSISGVRAYKRDDPAGYGPANLRTLVGGQVTTFNGLYEIIQRGQSQRQFSQELQALGSWDDVDYVAGLYYFRERGSYGAATRLPFALGNGSSALDVRSSFLYGLESKSLAGFTQINWRPSALDKKLEISGGVRWTRDKRDFDQTIGVIRTANLKTDNVSYLASASYQWTPSAMTYFRYATGYRAGGFNSRATAAQNPVYQPEKIRSYEVGFKLEALDRRLRLNGAAFYNKYDNLQVGFFLPPNAAGAGGNVAVNANARYEGFELELTAVPIDGLNLNASVGYVDPKYENYPQPLGTGGALAAGCSPIVLNGATVAQNCAAIAHFSGTSFRTAAAGVSYVFPPASYGEWSIRTDYAYRGPANYDTFNNAATPFFDAVHADGYGLLSARLTLSDIPLTPNVRARLAFFGENLTNKAYNIQGVDFSYMAAIVFGDPRTFGVEGKIEF
jgi:iron complex outermembrane receptor protein